MPDVAGQRGPSDPDPRLMVSEAKSRSQPATARLPEFDAPPLFETVFGVRFPRLKKWDVRHFGLFWEHVKDDYPGFETKPSLPTQDSDPKPSAGGIAIQLVTEPELRCWYLVPDGTRLLQVQRDAFFHNWRKVTLDEAYPRYAAIRPAFQQAWERFHAFLASHGIHAPEVVECEATYVNHLEKGREWRSIADQGRVLRWLSGATPEPTRLNLTASVTIDGHTLDVVLRPVVRRQDGLEILQFNLTARGRPESSDVDSVMAWMDSARASIVRAFTELTTAEMHEIWSRTS